MKILRRQKLAHAAAWFILAFILSLPTLASAHGPDGDHGKQTSGAVVSQSQVTAPRFEAATDLFELVAVLAYGELSIVIDRFETNAPVLEAKVDVESGATKAVARYRADHGDYAVDDPAFIALVVRPGEHAIVITVAAGSESDLLNGTLVVPDANARAAAAGHSHGDQGQDQLLERWSIAAAGVVLLAWIVVLWQRRRRKRQRNFGTPRQVQS